MPYSPLVSKIRCHNPNKNKSRVCNRNYLVYIGTREGVDLTNVDYLQQERKLENLDDNSIREESANNLYAHYIAERPGSNGLFGNIDTADINQTANDIANLTAQGRTIYRGIVSLSEKDAIELGYNNKEKWVQFIHSSIPDVAKQFNIKIDKLQWVAAVHMEQHHPHCHYMFWSTDQKVTDPFIHISKQNACREILSKEMFKEEREQEVINKTINRDLLIDIGKEYISNEADKLYENIKDTKIMGRIKNDTLEKYGKDLLLLSSSLPTTGRLDYKLLPAQTKLKVNNFIDKILDEKELKKQYKLYMDSVDNISRTYSVTEKHFNINHKIADEDIRLRLSNSVIKTCKSLIREKNIFDKYIDKSILLSEKDNFGYKESLKNTLQEISSLVDMSEYDDMNFKYEWNKDYKKALKYIYEPEKKDINKALNLLIIQDGKNNILASMELGKLYSAGIIPKDNNNDYKKIGQKYYQKAYSGLLKLESENPKSTYEYKLGKLLEKGNGTDVNFSAAKIYYELAAKDGNKYAQYSLGNMYLHENIEKFNEINRKDLIQKGLSYIKEAADQEFAYASYTYAKVSETEKLSNEDYEKYYTTALSGFDKMLQEKRDDNLLYRIGTMYYEGKGTTSDPEIAYKYFKESADLNNANAQYALGKTYSDPKSNYYNISNSIKYLKMSIENKNIYAMAALAEIYSNEEFKECYDLDKAIRLYNESFNLGNINAAYKLGLLYSNKENDCYDLDKGISNYIKAAEHGNDYANYQLGKIYADNESKYYNLDLSIQYLNKAADNDNNFAMYELGKIYLDYEKSIYDKEKGIRFLNESANRNNIYALAKLGNIYLWGKYPGIEKNVEKGIDLLTIASDKGNDYAKNTLEIYKDIQNNIEKNLFIKTGYQCFKSLFSSLLSNRQLQESYDMDQNFRCLNKAAKKALATQRGMYVDKDKK